MSGLDKNTQRSTGSKANGLFDNINKVSCIIRNSTQVFIVNQDLSTQSIFLSLEDIEDALYQFYFVRISFNVIINTKHVSFVKSKRAIELKNGMQFKVSRKKWDLFK